LIIFVLGSATSSLIFYLTNKFRLRIINYLKISENLIKRYKKVDFLGSILIIFLGIILIYFLYLNTPYETEKTFLQLFFDHVNLLLFFTLGWIGFVYLVKKGLFLHDIMVIIMPWIGVCLFFFIIGFLTLKMGIYLIYPWRHLNYISPVGMILVSFGILHLVQKIKRNNWKIILFLVIFFFAILLVADIPRWFFDNYRDNTELVSMKWVREYTEKMSVIGTDTRLSSVVWGLAERYPTWNSDEIFTKNISDKGFQYDVYVEQGYYPNQRGTDYILWSDEYNHLGVYFGELEYNRKLDKTVESKFESSNLFDKIYSNQNVRLYRVNKLAHNSMI
jgi:hypothetical protein